MNQTEEKAYKWLILQGYRPEDLVYQARGTPDFIASDGRGYEVKRTIGQSDKSVWMTHAQFTKIKEGGWDVLVFQKVANTPVIVPAKELGNGVVRGIRFTIGEVSGGRRIVLQDDEYWKLQEMRVKYKTNNLIELFAKIEHRQPERIGTEQMCVCGHSEAAHDGGGCLGNGAQCDCAIYRKAESEPKQEQEVKT